MKAHIVKQLFLFLFTNFFFIRGMQEIQQLIVQIKPLLNNDLHSFKAIELEEKALHEILIKADKFKKQDLHGGEVEALFKNLKEAQKKVNDSKLKLQQQSRKELMQWQRKIFNKARDTWKTTWLKMKTAFSRFWWGTSN